MTENDFEVLAVNPGSTSTKLGWYHGEEPLWSETIRHDPRQLAQYGKIAEQYSFRLSEVKTCLQRRGADLQRLSAIVGRGGIIDPLPSGTFYVDDKLVERLLSGKPWEHASNLGGVLARGIADPLGIPAYIVDPVSVDELEDEARVQGLPGFEKYSLNHVLNVKATMRRAAKELCVDWKQCNFIVAHMGGGFTICALKKGRLTDFYSGNSYGPLSPERAGSLPASSLVHLCFSGTWDRLTLKKKLAGGGGLMAWFGTSDAIEVKKRIATGDKQADKVWQAMICGVAEAIGMMAAALSGDVKAILFTGGLANDSSLIASLTGMTEWIAPCLNYPGEDELKALAQGALRILCGTEQVQEYRPLPPFCLADLKPVNDGRKR